MAKKPGPARNNGAGMMRPDAVPGADGISDAARGVAAKPDLYRQSLEQAIESFPESQREGLRRELMGDNYKAPSAGDIQRSFDAIHQGSGGMSDGAGQVWKDTPKSPAGKVPGKGSSLSREQAQQFSSADMAFSGMQESNRRAAAGEQQGNGWANGRGFANAEVQAAAQAARGATFDPGNMGKRSK